MATATPAAFGYTVVATGLVNPRGLAFGPDGTIYVAEAGEGGPREVELGRKRPHYVGHSGRVSAIRTGQPPRAIATGLPAIVTAAREEVGPTGLAFLDGTLYLLTASGGWDVGDATFNNGLFRLMPDGTLTRIFDLTRFNLTDPPQARRLDSRADVPGGMPFGLAATGGALYATDGNHDLVVRLTPDGQAHRILEHPASDHALTGITAGPDGDLYVAEYVPGKVTRLSPTGQQLEVARDLALPIGVALDEAGRVCVLEYVGRVVCVERDGRREVLADGLLQPTAMARGPDGDFYVSNHGHFSGKGEGEIVRISPRGRTPR